MEVKLQSGDAIAIPEGCKAVVKDGSVVFEKEQKIKDGDILAYADYSNKGTDAMGLYLFYVGVNCVEEISLPDDVDKRWGNGTLRYATEEEKQLLFDMMREQGLQWNAEEKRVERIRWRAEKRETYYRVDFVGNVFCEIDKRTSIDNVLYDTLNYFHTREQAEEAARRVKETLRKYHEETGE